ncbi:hypothetical protein GCM10010156_05660 [Planobispora rosea]|uniref:DUF7824 domain-containing protein n=1 Tax=Planobispora rosea TaxID=35762 RepID=A0A8J3RYW7_PLARO|nr:DUF6493 family protein [Planobispora rosea]GGS49832.1 hypothetical protein GCM10010156_05660 [Planobispora rosea]GIH83850.1 hypothetical protein Pro02_22580 [Planobispora rosea]
MSVWEEVRALIDAGDADEVAARVAELGPAERREVAGELPGHIPAARAAAHRAAADKESRLLAERDQAGRLRKREFIRYAAERGIAREDYHRHWAASRQDGWGGGWGENPHGHWLHGWGPDTMMGERDAWIDPMRAAGAGTIAGAAAVVSWLNRREFARRGSPADAVGPVVRAVAARPAGWRADLAARLALKVRVVRGDVSWHGDPVDRHLPLALELFRRLGTAPPEHDPLVVGWVTMTPDADRLREDPLLEALLPRIFQAQGVGRALREERADPLAPASWLGTLRALAAEGRISREVLLGGCVGRFLRGGDATDLRFFARLHELLEPSAAEVATRRRDYLRLLPVAPGPVAELALRHLRRLDADPAGTVDAAEALEPAGTSGAPEPPDPADAVEALEGLLFRAEGGLVRSGLAWLEELLKADPGRADDLAPALASALGHQAHAVQERAVRLAVKHAAAFTPLGARMVREATGQLPPDLHNRVAAAFGGELREGPGPGPEPEEALEPREIPRLPAATVFPPVPQTPREVAALYGKDDWTAAELFLAGFVRHAARDRAGLRSALAPHRAPIVDRDLWWYPEGWAAALVAELAQPGVGYVPEGFAFPAEPREGESPDESWGSSFLSGALRFLNGVSRAAGIAPFSAPPRPAAEHIPDARQASAPHRFILHRYAEILTALREGALPPLLLATPTLSTGHLDPAELVARLTELEEAGTEPLPADLLQALLRLPRTAADPAVTARAAGLASAAGREAARWLAGDGMPDPEVTVRWFHASGQEHQWWKVAREWWTGGERPAGHWLDEEEPDGELERWQTMAVVSITPAGDTGVPGRAVAGLAAELLSPPVPIAEEAFGYYGTCEDWWPAVLPSHREVLAAHLVPIRFWYYRGTESLHWRLTDLAVRQGPAGQATSLLLAERLAGGPSEQPLRALQHLAATGELPAARLGAEFGQRVRRSWARIEDVREVLEDTARQGAHREAWTMTAAMVPAILPAPGVRPRKVLLEFLAFARKLAGWAGARGEIPEVAAVAARRGDNRLLRECRSLHALLTSPARTGDES